ncbi:protein of unknown function [Methylobacterium sp. 275MFSha3.1]|uniref:type II toxin-antitoxin system toxin DNA ADP-ribosyl transferase DarT n=1 Tax=Methylobacterium sp. 275MFSha3.1 TaxID=1502746 RepID=UPI0008A7B3C5|nr:DUF4433 domain-containing protein [Methylobacterium sp. 275MFSha3.1]SEH34302.1 protein of unknown function [Methylobacterium sp. 275MFSha3.1]
MVDRGIIDLTPERGLIFRITHRNNLPWILDHGVHCRNSPVRDPGFVPIGLTDLIEKRNRQAVPEPPRGVLSDYVPFYFTPLSPMLLNIKTGRNGVIRRANEEIVILLTSLHIVARDGLPFLFTGGHASASGAEFFRDLADLDVIDWGILRAKDFARDPEDPRKQERYMAEALVHQVLPVQSLRAIGCSCAATQDYAKTLVDQRNLRLPIALRPSWYF